MQAPIVAVLALLVAVAYAQETDVHSATCLLQRVDDPFGPGTGTVTFTLSGSLTFSWSIAGLANGNHFMGLYTYGDILSSNGTTLGPLFVENSFFNVGNNPIVATNGVSTGTGAGTGYFLNGANDIIGRSIAVFGDGVDPNKLVMACVIGRADTKAQEDETQTTSDRFPAVRRATCQFRNTSFVTPAGYLAGWVDFEQATPNGPVTVEYFVHNVIRQDVVYHTSHIHWTGDISNDAAVATGPHYNNSYYVTSYGPRPGAVNELGSIGNPNVYNFTSDYKDTLTASFVDPIISLMGRNSIVGRSVIIHGWAASSATRIAQCVIGIKSDGEGVAPVPAISTMNGPQVANQYLTVNQTTRASALLKPTVAGTDKLTGMVQFETQPSGYVRVRYHIAGLTPGWHTWHVHEYGDLGTKADGLNTGAATGGHFIGIVSDRPAGTLQEVGALDNSKPIWADAYGYSRGEFIDTQIRLNGPNAIVGRSIIVHGNGTIAGIRVAQGVIGKRAETRIYDADIGPVGSSVQYAVAHVVYTSLGSTQLLGRVTFTQPSPNNDVSVHFDFAGLVPGAQHPWHVHQFGDLLGWDTVSSVAGHFIGINPVRPVGQKQEIGLLNDGIPLTADANGVSTGDFVDTQISLSGINSIVGRSIVVHVPVAAGGVARQAWGVIGVALYNSAVAAQPTWLLLVLVICAMLRMW